MVLLVVSDWEMSAVKIMCLIFSNYLIIKFTWSSLSCYHRLSGKAVISRRPLWYTDICKDVDQLAKLIYSVAAHCKRTAETLFPIQIINGS